MTDGWEHTIHRFQRKLYRNDVTDKNCVFQVAKGYFTHISAFSNEWEMQLHGHVVHRFIV